MAEAGKNNECAEIDAWSEQFECLYSAQRTPEQSVFHYDDARHRLYGEFVEKASKLFTDALTHELDDPSKFVHLYALVGKLRLFATASVISMAGEVMRLIVETYKLPNRDFRNLKERQEPDVDVVRVFSEACREELHV